MYLTSAAIRSRVERGDLRIEPYVADLRPASYVLHLGNRFRRWRRSGQPIPIWSDDNFENWLYDALDAAEEIIQPGEFLLAQTLEAISLPTDLGGEISPLSHVARFGLGIHQGANWINPGFGAACPTPLTLELTNHNPAPLILTANMPIAHLRITPVAGPLESSPDAGIYTGREPLAAPLFYQDLAPDHDAH